MKMLYILNTANRVNNFSYASMIAAQNLGVDFHIAGNWGYKTEQERILDEKKYGIHIHQIDFIRSPFTPRNFAAYKQLKALFDMEQFDAVHCNTPIGGLLGRLVSKKYKISKVIYQAHGFHFYKGAPKLNWMLYYPVEKWLAHYTDALVTINREDHTIAQELRLRNNGEIYFVPGVGIDLRKIKEVTVAKTKRSELGIPEEATLLLSVGELNENKNHETVIRALSELKDVYYIVAGEGERRPYLEDLIRTLDLSHRVKLLGFRTDIVELCGAADAFVFPSYREGLSVSVMEAMACGLPVVCSKIRGNTDLIDENGGILFDPHSVEDCGKAIKGMLASDMKNKGAYNKEKIKGFSTDAVIARMTDIYKKVLGSDVLT